MLTPSAPQFGLASGIHGMRERILDHRLSPAERHAILARCIEAERRELEEIAKYDAEWEAKHTEALGADKADWEAKVAKINEVLR